MMKKRLIVIVFGTVLLIAVAVVVALHERRQTVPRPEAPVAQTPAEVRVKAVEGKEEASAPFDAAEVSSAVAVVCGADEATADRYEARSDALKNDVMNLMRNQDPPAEELAETLIAVIEGRPIAGFGRSGRAGVPPPAADGDGTPSLPGNTIHPPVVIDYCIQHLGAMVNELDGAGRKAVRGVLRG